MFNSWCIQSRLDDLKISRKKEILKEHLLAFMKVFSHDSVHERGGEEKPRRRNEDVWMSDARLWLRAHKDDTFLLTSALLPLCAALHGPRRVCLCAHHPSNKEAEDKYLHMQEPEDRLFFFFFASRMKKSSSKAPPGKYFRVLNTCDRKHTDHSPSSSQQTFTVVYDSLPPRGVS